MDDLTARCAAAGMAVATDTDAAVHAGRALLTYDRQVDVVTAREVTVAARVAGAADQERELLIPRLADWRRPHRGADTWSTPLPPWGMRLARLIRAVRRTIGDADVVLHWADDGRRCRVVSLARR